MTTMTTEVFGHMPAGDEVLTVTLQTESLRARVMGYGAALADLEFRHPKGWRRLVLGLPTLQDYLLHSPHLGATAGRYAGRIRDGRVTIDGREHQLTRNAADGHHVHGGTAGLGKRAWSLIEGGATHATFEIQSAHGDEGYPGSLVARCTYHLDGSRLGVEMTATTTAPTPVNLLHHSYFNLDGGGTTEGHQLRIDADLYAATGADGLPTGAFDTVAGASDFRHLRQPEPGHAYDLSYLLASPAGTLRPVAELLSSSGDLRMVLSTSEAALHFYDGGKISIPVAGLDGRTFAPRAGLCLEPTRMSDAPNLPAFPSSILHPGETYRQTNLFAFSLPG